MRPTIPGNAGLLASKVPGSRSRAVTTGRYPPPNSTKMATKIARVTPNLRTRARVAFIVGTTAGAGGRISHSARAWPNRSGIPGSGGARVLDGARRRGVKEVEDDRTGSALDTDRGRARDVARARREEEGALGVVQADQGRDGVRQDGGRGPEGSQRLGFEGEELHHALDEASQDEPEGGLTPGTVGLERARRRGRPGPLRRLVSDPAAPARRRGGQLRRRSRARTRTDAGGGGWRSPRSPSSTRSRSRPRPR